MFDPRPEMRTASFKDEVSSFKFQLSGLKFLAFDSKPGT
jgi:hypothetical protein